MAFAISSHMPRESWWLDPDFYGRAKREQERMRLSRYGQPEQLITGVNAREERPRKSAAQEDE